MKREIIIKELINRGYKAEKSDNVKNGVIFKGIIIFNGRVSPVIYTDEIIADAKKNDKDLNYVVEKIIEIFEKHKDCDIDVNRLFDKEYVLKNLYIGLQKESEEDLVKGVCNFEGLETYLYIRVSENENSNATIKMKNAMFEKIGIGLSDAWKRAEENTNAETEIVSMAKIFAEMQGMEYSKEMDAMTPMYVISNKSRMKGASAILNHGAIRDFAENKEISKMVILPSSVHEMIILPYTDDMDIQQLNGMVKEINENEVSPEERLTDKAYIVEI